MELNYYIKTGQLKFAVTNGTWNEGDLLPLITHVHSDRESASPYAGNEGPYPSCDSRGNILLSNTLGGGADTGGGLGDTVSVGYWKYLYNKYMPAECLPVWRRDIDKSIHHSGQNNMMNVPATQGTANGIKVPNTSEILWDQTNKPWNADQRRNFHQDASSNLNLGFSITSNNLHSVKKGDATDGIQRYQTGWINTKTTAFLKNSGEGLMEAYQEIYNLGEVKPPVSFATASDYDKIVGEMVTISKNNSSGLLKINYGTKYKLPDRPASGNIIIQNSLGTFGSGIIPGSDFPPSKGNNGNKNGLTPQLHYRLNSINNSLIGRIANKYGTDNPTNFIGATSIKGLDKNTSPALSDLWMRQMAKKYMETPTTANFELPAVPFDGRGFNPNSNLIASVDKTTTGIASSSILNLSKNTDGYYLPIDASFCNLTTGEIDLSDIYDSSILNGENWGTQNDNVAGSGPQEAIATFSFEYQGGATGIDPRLSMPGGMAKNNPWSDSVYKNKFDPDQLAFTESGRTFATFMYAEMGQAYFTTDQIISAFSKKGDYTDAATNIMGDPGSQQKKIFILPSCEDSGACTSYSGTDLIFSGLSDPTRKTQFDGAGASDSNKISYGWTPNSNGFGGETNILSSLGVTSFTPMKNFIKASAMCMGGVDNIGKIKVGLYSQEFLPIGWLSDATDHDS